jgi:energy-coupling factor transport system permease protein
MFFVLISRIALHIGRGEEYARALAKLLSPLRRFRLPTGEIELVLGVAFRLIPILEREAGRLMLARRAHGTVSGWIGKIRQLPAILVPLFVGAFRRADTLAVSMEARGFAIGSPRSSYVQAHFGLLDLLVLLLVAAVSVAAIVLFRT